MVLRSDWPPETIRQLAKASGKPLEVVCGQAFLASPTGAWTAVLGSYFQDQDRVRELDVLAERVELQSDLKLRLRALVSCRGFALDDGLLTYSIASDSPLLLVPNALVECRLHAPLISDEDLSNKLGLEMAVEAIRAVPGDAARPLVALDVIHHQPEQKNQAEYKLKSDGRIYTALDSAVKAAMHWKVHDRQTEQGNFITFNLPICIFSEPFWDVGIDDGAVSEPVQRTLGFQTNSYPTSHRVRVVQQTNVTTLVVSRAELPALIKALDGLFDHFRDACLAVPRVVGTRIS